MPGSKPAAISSARDAQENKETAMRVPDDGCGCESAGTVAILLVHPVQETPQYVSLTEAENARRPSS